ncbi:MAG: outer membrane beta-barrel protein [Verrucomicrobiota bacterium]
MKFNKWTVALAAVGVVSLASAARAEEKASAVATALSSTTISGYVDTSAQWNFGTGNYNQPPYKFNSPSKADGFNLDVVQLTISKPLDETPWSAGYRVDLWFGPDANTLGTTSITGLGGGPSDFAIRQAYVSLNAPVGNGIDFKVGVFDSILGYESVESPNDPNYTRSYGHSMEPQTHTGVLATYHFCSAVSVSAGVADTVGSTINERAFEGLNTSGANKAESYKTYMGSIALTAPESMGFLAGSTLYAGFVNGFSDHAANAGGTGSQTSYYAGSTIATPIKELQFGVAFDYLDMSMVHGQTWAAAGYASYHATEKLSFHARGEYLKDSSGFFGYAGSTSETPFLTSDTVLAMTGTVQYDLWKNVISRLELRWDHSLSGRDAFGGATPDSSPDRQNAWLLAANIIYRF